jgi:predicted dehydrogenase
MKMNAKFNRRHFLKTTSAGAAAVSAGVWNGVALADSKAANGKLNIACIGTANRAAADINGVKGEEIVALVDVDSDYLNRALKDFPNARAYSDYREMIDKEGDRIDAVTVATSDHHHAPATIRSLQAGKHVYCEKPLTHTVQEARIITEAAATAGVKTQMGTQMHASDNYRRVVELVQSGVVGDVTEVHVWVGKSWGGGERPEGGQKPPVHLNWDLWLGPAPERPFWPGKYHPGQWRRWWDFGQGTLGDMACHYMDLPFWALKLGSPTRCRAEGAEVHPETCPMGLDVTYNFPSRGGMPECKLTWSDGNRIPKRVAGERVPGAGVMFIGTEGHMFADYNKYKIFRTDGAKEFQVTVPTIPKSLGHHAEWIKACKDGSPTTCDFSYSGVLTEAVLLGNVAYRTGKTIEWDAANLKATNCPEADAFLSKEYRKGWEVEPLKKAVGV